MSQEPALPKSNRSAFHCGWLLPVEIALIFFALVCALLYQHFGLMLRDPVALYLPRMVSAVEWYGTGLVLVLLVRRLIDLRRARGAFRDTLTEFIDQQLNRSRLLEDLRLLNAISICFVIFLNLKHLIPFVNSGVFDSLLVLQERKLFGGRLGVEVVQDLLGPQVAFVLSESYLFFYPYMALLTLAVFFAVPYSVDYNRVDRDGSGRRLFVLRFVLVWLIGVISVYLFPTWGPCFFLPETVSELPQTAMTDIQRRLWSYKILLGSQPFDRAGIYIISGLPSLHFAIVLLGSLELKRLKSPLHYLSWVFLLLTGITTIYFGWHYVVDNVAAVLLVLLVNGLTSRFFVCPRPS